MRGDRDLDVRPVRTAEDWRVFFAIRDAIYASDPAAIRPLHSEQRIALDTERNPFYQHAEREVFVCWRGTQPVGRIAAILDRLHQEFHSDRTGFFGFFECENDHRTAAALIRTAAAWLTERGCDRMRGPVNPSMKGEFGVLLTGNEIPPTIMMAHTPAWYDSLLMACGFAKAHDFFVYNIDRSATLAKKENHWGVLEGLAKRVLDRNPDLEFRGATKHNVVDTVRRINDLGNRIRGPVFGFVPITDAELEFMVKHLKPVVFPEFIITAWHKQEVVGYLLAMPDINWALARTWGRHDLVRLAQMPFLLRRVPRLRVFALGADPAYSASGIVALLFHAISSSSVPRFEEFELSWISEQNVKALRAVMRVIPVEPRKTYRLYDALLPMA